MAAVDLCYLMTSRLSKDIVAMAAIITHGRVLNVNICAITCDICTEISHCGLASITPGASFLQIASMDLLTRFS